MEKTGQHPLATTYSWLDILDRTFFIYRENFLRFIVPVAVMTIPLIVLNLLSSYYTAGLIDDSTYTGYDDRITSSAEFEAELTGMMNNFFLLIAATIGIVAIAGIIQGVFINGIITYMTSEHHLRRSVTVREAFAAIRSRLGGLFVGLLVWWLLILALGIGFALVFFYACGLLVGPIVYVAIALYGFLTPIFILEPVNIGTGLRRAWDLGKARLWPVFWFIMAISVISITASLGLTSVVALLFEPTVGSLNTGVSQVVQIIASATVGIFLAPVLPIGLTLLYYDTRVRYEALDIALQMIDVPDARPSDLDTPPPVRRGMAGRDFANMMIMTAIFFAPVLLVFALGIFL
jgi:hypothetical protein